MVKYVTFEDIKCPKCNSAKISELVIGKMKGEKLRVFKCKSCKKSFNYKPPKKRKTNYPRNWSNYNLSQTKEKEFFLNILNSAVECLDIPKFEYKGVGRKRIPIKESIKLICIKVFNGFGSRRSICDIKFAHAMGYVNDIHHYNTINNRLNDPVITPHLEKLYKLLALPLVPHESDFATDATGFSTVNKKRWYDLFREKGYRDVKDYKKLHIMVGVKSKIIAAARVTKGFAHDSPEFKHILKDASQRFKIAEVYGDSGYLSKENCNLVSNIGAIPFIMPKANIRVSRKQYTSIAWNSMIRYWQKNKEDFKRHYHKRSNVEAAFSMVKRKFSTYLRTKTNVAQTNEILCKVICHNIAVLVKSIFDLDIDLNFDN